MAFKQGNNPLARKTSPMRRSPFRQQSQSMSMDELQKMSAAQDAASKAQADKLPQIEKPGFDYEMDQDMSYPGGERGADYDEEGTKDGMSRKESPLNDGGNFRGKDKNKNKNEIQIEADKQNSQEEGKAKGPDWSKAPKNNTPERKQWYIDNNLKQDETTKLRDKKPVVAVNSLPSQEVKELKVSDPKPSGDELSKKIKDDIVVSDKKNSEVKKSEDKNSKAKALRMKAEDAQDGSVRGGEKANRLRKRYDRVNKRQEKKDKRQEKKAKKFAPKEEKTTIKDPANPTAKAQVVDGKTELSKVTNMGGPSRKYKKK